MPDRRTSPQPGRTLAFVLATVAFATPARADEPSRPFEVRLRSRVEDATRPGTFRLVETTEAWEPARTALIVCDMWDLHHCKNAVGRVGEIAPTMNRLLTEARGRGSVIIHAPSGCVGAYADHPARRHATATPRSASIPTGIGSWCSKIPSEDRGVYPIDQSDGGEDDDPAEHAAWAKSLASLGRDPKAPWKKETDALTIAESDYISDSGEEIWSILDDRKVEQVVLMGVHLNMCVLGRPFGLRQMASHGRKVSLVRDLTDTMYNPAMPPRVGHFAGTDLLVEHVEKYVCPTFSSDQILGGRPVRFKGDTRPVVAFVIAEDEYRTESTLPTFASAQRTSAYHPEFIVDPSRGDLPGLLGLDSADLAFISVRRRPLPKDQLDAVRRFVAAGKPVVAIRTASHAFASKIGSSTPPARETWPEFDATVLGGHYQGHHPGGPLVTIRVATTHPILAGVDPTRLEGHGSLYRVSPLGATATPLLVGSVPDAAPEPVAWVNAPDAGGRVFYTSLGHPDHFASADFDRLLRNAIDWALGR